MILKNRKKVKFHYLDFLRFIISLTFIDILLHLKINGYIIARVRNRRKYLVIWYRSKSSITSVADNTYAHTEYMHFYLLPVQNFKLK